MTEDGVTTSYTYDAANRLLSSTTGSADKTYTYDDNRNLLTEVVQLKPEILPPGPVAPIFPILGDDLQSMVLPGVPRVQNTYNDANQLTETTIGSRRYVYSYYPSGLRKSKEERNTTSGLLISTREYTWNGDQLALEGFEDAVTRYYYGLGLFANDYNYYCSDAHGNVRMLVSGSGILRQKYAYDAFGNEKPAGSSGDAEIMGQDYDLTEGQSAPTIAPNPFRYCGEYYDTETGLYYLRARYYDPTVGRFTQEDTHWNTANMIYGDNPQKINEREDALGLKTYSYAPQISAIVQSGNLYVYSVNNPVMYADPTGDIILSTLAILMIGGAVLCGTIGGIRGYNAAEQAGLTGWDKAIYTTNSVLFGGIIGSLGGYVLAPAVVAGTGIAGISISSMGISTIAAAGTTFGTYGTLLAQNPNITVDWSIYAKHGLERMAERGITQQMVDSWVKNGKVLQQGSEKFMFITREGVAVVTKAGKLVTAYSSAQFKPEIWEIVRKLFGR